MTTKLLRLMLNAFSFAMQMLFGVVGTATGAASVFWDRRRGGGAGQAAGAGVALAEGGLTYA